eukprot:2111604-Rhodomonas_salina.9
MERDSKGEIPEPPHRDCRRARACVPGTWRAPTRNFPNKSARRGGFRDAREVASGGDEGDEGRRCRGG